MPTVYNSEGPSQSTTLQRTERFGETGNVAFALTIGGWTLKRDGESVTISAPTGGQIWPRGNRQ